MLLLEMENEPIRGTSKDMTNFAELLVREEGPAILRADFSACRESSK